MDDVNPKELATQIMGYAPGSKQDLGRRRDEAQKHIQELKASIAKSEEWLGYWENRKEEVLEQLNALKGEP